MGVIPAYNLLDPPVTFNPGQLILWSLALAFIGVFCAVPLRHQTILREKLRFPSGQIPKTPVWQYQAKSLCSMKLACIAFAQRAAPVKRTCTLLTFRVAPRVGSLIGQLELSYSFGPEQLLGMDHHLNQACWNFAAGTATANVIRTLHAQPEAERPNPAEGHGSRLRSRRPTLRRLSEGHAGTTDIEIGGQVGCIRKSTTRELNNYVSQTAQFWARKAGIASISFWGSVYHVKIGSASALGLAGSPLYHKDWELHRVSSRAGMVHIDFILLELRIHWIPASHSRRPSGGAWNTVQNTVWSHGSNRHYTSSSCLTLKVAVHNSIDRLWIYGSFL